MIECGQAQPTRQSSSFRVFLMKFFKFCSCFDIFFFEELISPELSLDTKSALFGKVLSWKLTSLGRLQAGNSMRKWDPVLSASLCPSQEPGAQSWCNFTLDGGVGGSMGRKERSRTWGMQ